jgi:hypothetical protein
MLRRSNFGPLLRELLAKGVKTVFNNKKNKDLPVHQKLLNCI